MNDRHAAALILTVALGACHSGTTVTATNATTSEVAAKVDAAGAEVTIAPGRWEAMAATEMKMPGLSPAQQAQVARKQTMISCVTPEQVKQHRALFTGNKELDKSCKYDHFTMGGGKLDAAMSCAMGGAQSAMTMKGSYGADRYAMTMTMAAKGAGPMAAMNSTVTIDAKRVGACRGDEKG